MSREWSASVRRDIANARHAGVDQEFCVAARQAVEDCSNMYRNRLRGLLELEPGIRRERRAYYMAQYVFRMDAIAAVARAYAAQVRAIKGRG